MRAFAVLAAAAGFSGPWAPMAQTPEGVRPVALEPRFSPGRALPSPWERPGPRLSDSPSWATPVLTLPAQNVAGQRPLGERPAGGLARVCAAASLVAFLCASRKLPTLAVEGAPNQTEATQGEAEGVVKSTSLPDRKRGGDPSLDSTVFRRAEFWNSQTATLREVLNVLGRFESADEWKERTKFLEVENIKAEDERQAWTKKRYEMAQRMGMCERVGLEFNAPNLPFRNEALARSVGCTIEDFADMEVTPAACGLVFDALAESKSTLILPKVADQRRSNLFNEDGSFNELAFRAGLYKSRFVIVVSWFMFGKGNFIWVLVFAQFLHDYRPDLFPTPKDLGLFKIGTFI